MSVCIFIAADVPLQEMSPSKEYPIHIDLDKGIIDDGGADDNFFLFSFPDVKDYADIYELDHADIWNSSDKNIPSRPSFYRLIITL